MELVQIDPVGAQPTQRLLDGADDVAAGAADSEVATTGPLRVHAELGGDYDIVAVALQPLAKELFAQPGRCAVGVRDIEKGDADLEGSSHNGVGTLLGEAASRVRIWRWWMRNRSRRPAC